jgi:hypothetical protein
MARSHFIYLIRDMAGTVVGANTVKHEANSWAKKKGYGPNTGSLSRIKDGDYGGMEKKEEVIPWEQT